MEAPKVFISYSHDSPEHAERVLTLSDRLRQDGIDSHIDQYEVSPPEGWPRWMVNKVEWADFVLVVCTETYQQRFKGKAPAGQGKGVKWEGAILTQELYDAEAQNTRFIPVVFSSEGTAYIPVVLKGQNYYDVSTETGYEALYRHLTNQPLILKPILGKLKSMPPLEHKTKNDYQYDIAFSFAGEDRNYVEQVAKFLNDHGVSLFYDTYEQIDLWGKDLYVHLDEVYRLRSKYCVIFISKFYKDKLWTNHERGSAQVRAFQENKEYILPARFDDTEVPGIRPTIGYINLQELSPEKFGFLILDKIKVIDKTEKDVEVKGTARICLSTESYLQCRDILLNCSEFDSDDALSALFTVNAVLSPFRHFIPNATKNRNERVDRYLSFLLEKQLRDGKPLLLPFLNLLYERQPKESILRDQLSKLISDIQNIFRISYK